MLIETQKLREVFPNLPEISQINSLTGVQNSLRGFHSSPYEDNHWKIVSCVEGCVRDAILDLRIDSLTFGNVGTYDIDARSGCTILIPPGFAHAVQSLTSHSVTVYATNIAYTSNREFAIYPLSDHWGSIWMEDPILSERDRLAQVWENYLETILKL